MNLSSSILKNRAKIKLQGIYGQSVVVSMIYTFIISLLSSGGAMFSVFSSGGLESFFSAVENGLNGDPGAASSSNPFYYNVSYSPLSSIGTLAVLVLSGPLMVGVAHYFLHVADRNNPQLNDLFGEFKNFGNTFVLYVLTTLFTCLWTMLFIIPGIVAAISYSMAPYIVAEHPEIKASDAIRMSKQMMQGHKGDYFILQISFIGWGLLCLLTCGIGFLFLEPYISAANAEFFNEVSGKNVEKRNMGIDPDGTGTFFGDGAGYGQPGAAYDGTGYPQQTNVGGYTGYPGQDTAPGGYAGYSQPGSAAPNGYAGYTQPDSTTPDGYTGYSQTGQNGDGNL